MSEPGLIQNAIDIGFPVAVASYLLTTINKNIVEQTAEIKTLTIALKEHIAQKDKLIELIKRG